MPLRAIVLAVSVVVIVACTVVAVLAAVGIARHDTKDRLRAEYSPDFASQVIVNLTSFSPKTTDNALKTLEQQTSGRARTQISDSIEQVTSLVKSTNVETKTTVLSSAVTNATADEGSVIMVYGWEQRSPRRQGRAGVSDVPLARRHDPDQRPTQDDELRVGDLVPAGNAQTETTLPEARHRQPSGTADGGRTGRAAGGLGRLGHRARRALPRCPCRRAGP